MVTIQRPVACQVPISTLMDPFSTLLLIPCRPASWTTRQILPQSTDKTPISSLPRNNLDHLLLIETFSKQALLFKMPWKCGLKTATNGGQGSLTADLVGAVNLRLRLVASMMIQPYKHHPHKKSPITKSRNQKQTRPLQRLAAQTIQTAAE